MTPFKIVHLDDHWQDSKSTKDLITAKFDNIAYSCITDTRLAYRYVVNSIQHNRRIDLFITDFSHSWINGYEFAGSIRILEKSLKRVPMPILLYTMHHIDILPEIGDGLAQGFFTDYANLNLNRAEFCEKIQIYINQQILD